MTETNKDRCIMAPVCKFAGKASHCHDLCFPFRKAHGESGDSGVVSLAGVPKKYKTANVTNLPIKEDNPEIYEAIIGMCENIDGFIEEGVGLYLYSQPNPENPRGTGTGKTTSALTILNTYLQRRLVQHIKGEKDIKDLPALFVKASKFQNLYNSQYRGTDEEQKENQSKFYRMKKQMIETDLLVLDDIALRGATEAFVNEMYEIIDERTTEEKAIILTSNEPIETVGKVLSEQIRSRIEGSCVMLAFEGTDHRKRGV
jgi:DNA replication protein DnaC